MKGIFNGWLQYIYIYTHTPPLEHQIKSLESLANPRTIVLDVLLDVFSWENQLQLNINTMNGTFHCHVFCFFLQRV